MGLHSKYPTDGCILWGDCFSCPFPDDCISGKKAAMKRRAEAIDLKRQGCDVHEIAWRVGRSERQVERYLTGVNIGA